MGNRRHIQTKHIIEYGQGEYFNWQMTEFENLLTEAGADINNNLNDDAVGTMEIEADSLKEAVETIREWPKEKAESFLEGYTKDEILEVLDRIIQKGTIYNGYYFISWF